MRRRAATPEGVASFSPGLPYSATLGDVSAPRTSRFIFNLEEVAACTAPTSRRLASERRNPFGVGKPSRSGRPKVAEYGNLGLWVAIPLGLSLKFPIPAHTSMDRLKRSIVIRRYQVALNHTPDECRALMR